MDLFIMLKVVFKEQRKHYSNKMIFEYTYAMIYRLNNVSFENIFSVDYLRNLDTHIVFWVQFNNRTYQKPSLFNFPQLSVVAGSTFFNVRKFFLIDHFLPK